MDVRSRIEEAIKSPEAATQYGSRDFPVEPGRPFRNRPRLNDTDGLSLQTGALPPLRIAQVCLRRQPREGDGVRFTTVAALRQAGFSVTATPSRRNPGHLSVQFDGDWTDEVASRFDSCFTEGLFVSTAVEGAAKEVEANE